MTTQLVQHTLRLFKLPLQQLLRVLWCATESLSLLDGKLQHRHRPLVLVAGCCGVAGHWMRHHLFPIATLTQCRPCLVHQRRWQAPEPTPSRCLGRCTGGVQQGSKGPCPCGGRLLSLQRLGRRFGGLVRRRMLGDILVCDMYSYTATCTCLPRSTNLLLMGVGAPPCLGNPVAVLLLRTSRCGRYFGQILQMPF